MNKEKDEFFIKANIKERILYHYIVEDSTSTDNQYYYTPIDGYDYFDSSAITTTAFYDSTSKLILSTSKSLTEIKVRTNRQNKYNSTIIELKKLIELYNLIQERNTPTVPYYTVFFSDSYVIFNLSSYIDKMVNGTLIIDGIRCGVSTMADRGEAWKPCINLYLSRDNSAIIQNSYYSNMQVNKLIEDGELNNMVIDNMVDRRYKQYLKEIK